MTTPTAYKNETIRRVRADLASKMNDEQLINMFEKQDLIRRTAPTQAEVDSAIAWLNAIAEEHDIRELLMERSDNLVANA